MGRGCKPRPASEWVLGRTVLGDKSNCEYLKVTVLRCVLPTNGMIKLDNGIVLMATKIGNLMSTA